MGSAARRAMNGLDVEDGGAWDEATALGKELEAVAWEGLHR